MQLEDVFTAVIHTRPRMKFSNSMAAELLGAFDNNEGTNNKKKTSIIQGILK